MGGDCAICQDWSLPRIRCPHPSELHHVSETSIEESWRDVRPDIVHQPA